MASAARVDDRHERALRLVANFCSKSSKMGLKTGGGLGSQCRAYVEAAGATALLGSTAEVQAEVAHWVGVADELSTESPDVDIRLQVLNVHLETRSVFAGKGLEITVADLSLFAVVHGFVTEPMYPQLEKVPHLLRWIDYIQCQDAAAQVYPHIPVNNKAKFNPPKPAVQAPKTTTVLLPSIDRSSATSKPSNESSPASAVKPENPSTVEVTMTKKVVVSVMTETPEADPKEKKVPEVQDTKDSKPKEKKEKKEKAPAVKKESDTSFSVLDIRVGVIKKVWKHPGADALYVEEIDIGEPNPRQIVSGLAKFLTEGQMMNRKVIVLANVKASKVRDVLSAGLVLCASNSDHTQCEPVVPPSDAKIGEKVMVEGCDGAPEETLNPKKKQFEKIQPDLATNASGIACYQGSPFLLSGKPCTSSIVNAIVK